MLSAVGWQERSYLWEVKRASIFPRNRAIFMLWADTAFGIRLNFDPEWIISALALELVFRNFIDPDDHRLREMQSVVREQEADSP